MSQNIAQSGRHLDQQICSPLIGRPWSPVLWWSGVLCSRRAVQSVAACTPCLKRLRRPKLLLPYALIRGHSGIKLELVAQIWTTPPGLFSSRYVTLCQRCQGDGELPRASCRVRLHYGSELRRIDWWIASKRASAAPAAVRVESVNVKTCQRYPN